MISLRGKILIPSLLLVLVASIIGTIYLLDITQYNDDGLKVTVFRFDDKGNLVEEATLTINGVKEAGYITISFKAIPDSIEEAFSSSDLVAEIRIVDIYVVKVPRSSSEVQGNIGYIIFKAKVLNVFKGELEVDDVIHLISLGDIDISNSILYRYSDIPFFEVGEQAIIFAKKLAPFPGDTYGQMLIDKFPNLYEVPFTGFKLVDNKLVPLSPLSPGQDYTGMDINKFREEILPSFIH